MVFIQEGEAGQRGSGHQGKGGGGSQATDRLRSRKGAKLNMEKHESAAGVRLKTDARVD